jgi:steroid 5-alpha reductase family enzyme
MPRLIDNFLNPGRWSVSRCSHYISQAGSHALDFLITVSHTSASVQLKISFVFHVISMHPGLSGLTDVTEPKTRRREQCEAY